MMLATSVVRMSPCVPDQPLDKVKRTDEILMLQFGVEISNNALCVPEQPLDKVMLKATTADNKYNSPSLIDWDVIEQEFQLSACLHDRFFVGPSTQACYQRQPFVKTSWHQISTM